MAFTAVAALVSGAEVTTALVLSAAAEVGTAMTVIGAVTGSKDLMKIGGAIALVGGVGGLVNGAISGAASEGAAAVGGTDAAGAVANDAASAGDYVNAADAMSDATTAGAQSSGIISNAATPAVGSELSAGAVQTPAQEMAQGVQTMPASTQTSGAAPNAGDAVTQQAPVVSGPSGAQAPTSPYDISLDPNSTPSDLRMQGGTQSTPTGAPQESSSFFSNFGNWVNSNKTLFSSGMQLAGGALNGMNQRQMWDQKMALAQQQVNQTSYGSQVGTWAPRVNATPGIINGGRA